MATTLELEQLYLAYFGRPPEAAALAYFANQSIAQVAATFEASSEAALDYPRSNGQADAAMVATVYVHLFGRVPSAAEAQYWAGVGASLKLSPALLALTISGAAQGSDVTASANRLAYVQQWVDSFNTLATNGKVSVADAMVLASQQLANIGAAPSSLTTALSATLVTLSPPPSAAPAPAPAPVQTVLTTGTDTITTSDGSPVFTATLGGGAPTLTANDSVHGNGNRLNITDASTSSSKDMLPSGVSLAGITTIALTTSGNAGTDASHPFDLSGATGLTSFILNASGTHGDFVTLVAGAAASITTSSATVGVGTSGAGSTLTLTDSALTTLNLAGNVSLASATTLTQASSTVSGATDHAALTFTVQVAGTAGNAGAVPGASGSAGAAAGSATVTLGNGGDTLTLSSQGGFGGAGAAALNNVSGSAGGNGGVGGAAGSDSITLGNGNDTVTLQDTGAAGGVGGAGTTGLTGVSMLGGAGGQGGDGGHVTLVLGNGNNTITDSSAGGAGGNGGGANITNPGSAGDATAGNGGNGGDGGRNTITVGNGDNTITDNSTGGTAGASGSATNSGAGASTVGFAGNAGQGGNNTITVGTGHNTLNLNSHGNDTVILGTHAGYATASTTPNQVINGAVTGLKIGFALDSTGLTLLTPTITGAGDVNAFLNSLEAAASGSPRTAAFGTFGGNSYLVESHTGVLGANDTVVVQIVGVHTAALSGTSYVQLTS